MEYPALETLSTRRHYHRRIPLKKDVGFGSMLLLLVLVLESTQYSYPAHWSASYREPLRSTIDKLLTNFSQAVDRRAVWGQE